MKFLVVLLFVPFLIIPAFAESQTLPTEKGTLDIRLTYDVIKPDEQTKIKIDFINPKTQEIQEHIDYTVKVSKDGDNVFAIQRTHTSVGAVKIPIEFNRGVGVYSMDIDVDGILFQIIPTEVTSFDIVVGDAHAELPTTPDTNENEGCLIATAAYGSELAPQVQQLREIRDDIILKTSSGATFMTSFNQVYYLFSPTVADFEREHPVFKEVMRMVLTPMLSSLHLLNYVEIDSEQEILGYGISLILLNIGMYVGIPVFGILKLCKLREK